MCACLPLTSIYFFVCPVKIMSVFCSSSNANQIMIQACFRTYPASESSRATIRRCGG